MKINLIHNQGMFINDDNPLGNITTRQNLTFDAFSFTCIGNPNQEKTICVFDMNLGKYDGNQFDGFCMRVDTLINSTKRYRQRVIPIYVVNGGNHFVSNEIRKNNKVVLLELSTIFGSKINSFLQAIGFNETMKVSNIEKIMKILETSGHAEELTRFFSFVFERIVNNIIHKIVGNQYSKIESWEPTLLDGTKKEFDGCFESADEIVVVESKAYKKSKIKWEDYENKKEGVQELRDDCGKYFFEEKRNFLLRWMHENNRNKKLKMVFIAANGFSKDFKNESSVEYGIINKSEFVVMCGTELLDYCQKNNIKCKDERKWLKQYYLQKRKEDTVYD